MAEAEIGRHAEEAMSRWPLQGLTIIHRFGRIKPGENIVLVVTASSHRQAAFQAAEFLMDYLKTNAPFWKHEESAAAQAGSRRRAMTTPPPRAGPNPDGERAKPAAKRGRSMAKLPKVGAGELQTLLDFVRYAVSRFAEANSFSPTAPPIRLRKPRSWPARRCICIPTSSSRLPRARHRRRRQEDPRLDRAPHLDAQAGRLSGQ